MKTNTQLLLITLCLLAIAFSIKFLVITPDEITNKNIVIVDLSKEIKEDSKKENK